MPVNILYYFLYHKGPNYNISQARSQDLTRGSAIRHAADEIFFWGGL